jgi:NifB/MoaA-like Fe-S oxidoreductase
VHTQIVLCPEWNDGAHLERTIEDLWSIGPGVLSLSVVPVGLTQYNLGRPVRLLTREEAARALAQTERARQCAFAERGTGWLYAGDELFFIAGAEIPGAAYYDDWPLTENGVGSVRRLLDDFRAGVAQLPRLDGRRIALLTGTRMAPVLAPLAAEAAARTGALIEVHGVANSMFGPTVNTAGLLPGAALRAAVQAGDYDTVLLPGEALNDAGRFVDDLPLAELRAALAPAAVVPGHDLITTLGGL